MGTQAYGVERSLGCDSKRKSFWHGLSRDIRGYGANSPLSGAEASGSRRIAAEDRRFRSGDGGRVDSTSHQSADRAIMAEVAS